jgi:hypothetical protein
VHPNFSASGLPIQFGFLRANGSSNGGPGYTLAAGIDNWQISIFALAAPSAAAIPTLGEMPLVALASLMVLVGLVYLRRTRR